MHFVLLYASIEGQTRKIVRHIEDHLKERHHSTIVMDTTDDEAELDLTDVDGVVACAPVHAGAFPNSLVRALSREHTALMAFPGAFVSVSLAVASKDKSEVDEIEKIVHDLSETTGWWPVMKHHAAGALKYLEYDYFKRWIMKRIAKKSAGPIDTSQDYEFTDWDALDRFIDQFCHDLPLLKDKI